MKIILRILLINITLLVSLAWSANLTSYQGNYNSDSDVWIELQDKPNNRYDWVGIYPSDSNNDWENVVAWRWAKDTSPTQVDQGDWYKFNLEDGSYEARFFLNNSFTVNSKVSLNVGDVPSVTLKTKNKYKSDEVVNVKISGELSENKDWVGVYPVGSSNDWKNVLAWNWVYEGDNSLNKKIKALTTGNYEARLFFNNSFEVAEKVSFTVAGNNENDVIIGARPVKSTPINKGTLFASVNGGGDCMSKESPCDIYMAFSKLETNSVLLIKGGKYKLSKTLIVPSSGTKEKPIIIESYNKEKVILDGQASISKIKNNQNKVYMGINVENKNYIIIRNLEIKHMGAHGVRIHYGNNNIVEGCKIYDNFGSAILLSAQTDEEKRGTNAKNINNYYPSVYAHHIIKDNEIYNNSDAGIGSMNKKIFRKSNGISHSYANGNNADGITISTGDKNIITHNTLYDNSDEGIDVWRSTNTKITYNIVYNSGKHEGDGNGIKTGGNKHFFYQNNAPHGKNSIVTHNIAFNNRANGIDVNQGRNVTFKYNTSYNNDGYGFITMHDTKTQYNISSHNKIDDAVKYDKNNNIYIPDDSLNNSWTSGGIVSYINKTDKALKDFLRPKEGLGFEDMGAYANLP